MQELSSGPNSAATLDDLDLDIVAALHIAPRVPTAALAEILGVPTSTANRRLARMQDERLLRIVGRYDWGLVTSSNPFELWITSAPGQTRAVLEELLHIPDVQLAMHISGPADIYVNLFPLRGSDHEELLGVRIPSIPGVRAMDSRMILEPAKLGQVWRLRRLNPEQINTLEMHSVSPSETSIARLEDLSELELDTMKHLGIDGRISAAALARKLGVSASTAARSIRTLIQSGAVAPRVDIHPALIGYPLQAIVSLDLRPSAIRTALADLARHPNIRLLTVVTGGSPVSLFGVFESPASLAHFMHHDLGRIDGLRSTSSVAGLRLERRYWIDFDGNRLSQQVPSILG